MYQMYQMYQRFGLMLSPTATMTYTSNRAPFGKSATAMAVLAGYDLSGKYEL